MDKATKTLNIIRSLSADDQQTIVDANDLTLLSEATDEEVESLTSCLIEEDKEARRGSPPTPGVLSVVAFLFLIMMLIPNGLSFGWLVLYLPALFFLGLMWESYFDEIKRNEDALRPLKYQLHRATSIKQYCDASAAADAYRAGVLKNRSLYGFDETVMRHFKSHVVTVNLLSSTPVATLVENVPSLIGWKDPMLERKDKL